MGFLCHTPYIWRPSRENRPWGLCRCHATVWHDTDFSRIYSMMSAESNSEKSVSYQKKDGRGHPSFGMATTKTLRSIFSWHTSYCHGCFFSFLWEILYAQRWKSCIPWIKRIKVARNILWSSLPIKDVYKTEDLLSYEFPCKFMSNFRFPISVYISSVKFLHIPAYSLWRYAVGFKMRPEIWIAWYKPIFKSICCHNTHTFKILSKILKILLTVLSFKTYVTF